MNSNVSIRDYERRDLNSMFQLDEACFAEEFRFDLNSMKKFAEEPGALVRIADVANAGMAGFLIVHFEDMVRGVIGYIVTLDVADRYRRQGVAALLMLDAERRAAAAGAIAMSLHVFTGNAGAIRFYERIGYGRVGMRRGFYGRTGLDAFIYRKDLANGKTTGSSAC